VFTLISTMVLVRSDLQHTLVRTPAPEHMPPCPNSFVSPRASPTRLQLSYPTLATALRVLTDYKHGTRAVLGEVRTDAAQQRPTQGPLSVAAHDHHPHVQRLCEAAHLHVWTRETSRPGCGTQGKCLKEEGTGASFPRR